MQALSLTGKPGRWVPLALIAPLPSNPQLTALFVSGLVHMASAISYAVRGAFQFSPSFPRRHPKGPGRQDGLW